MLDINHFRHPALIAHCDWGKDPKKRWMAVATRTAQSWNVDRPELVGDTSTLLDRLQQRRSEEGATLIGFDFPIGLPVHLAAQLDARNFRELLEWLATPEWSDWFSVCERPDQISPRRPFFPLRNVKKGEIRKSHLLDALNATDGSSLLRLCERGGPGNAVACAMFWTLGSNQVGKGMLTGWSEIIVPHRNRTAIWPFDGDLQPLLNDEQIILCETYPADVYSSLGLPPKHLWSKRSSDGRRSCAHTLSDWLGQHAQASQGLLAQVASGFGPKADGEDRFDALVGLLGMMDVVERRRDSGNPPLASVGEWEGWILGRQSYGTCR